jgi:hypothetical protein
MAPKKEKTLVKKRVKKKDNSIRLRFIPEDLFNEIKANAEREFRSYPDEVLRFLIKNYRQ